jgi:hypothetical protein
MDRYFSYEHDKNKFTIITCPSFISFFIVANITSRDMSLVKQHTSILKEYNKKNTSEHDTIMSLSCGLINC